VERDGRHARVGNCRGVPKFGPRPQRIQVGKAAATARRIPFNMRIRLRGPSGASTLNLGEDATVGDLRSSITEKTSLTRFDIKYGYPPKPLYLDTPTALLSSLDVRLDGEQLTISAHDGPGNEERAVEKDAGGSQSASNDIPSSSHKDSAESWPSGQVTFAGMSGTKAPKEPSSSTAMSKDPISLKRKGKDMEVPELPLPDRGATMGT
jgi:ubiquitin thioesterase OTU1